MVVCFVRRSGEIRAFSRELIVTKWSSCEAEKLIMIKEWLESLKANECCLEVWKGESCF